MNETKEKFIMFKKNREKEKIAMIGNIKFKNKTIKELCDEKLHKEKVLIKKVLKELRNFKVTKKIKDIKYSEKINRILYGPGYNFRCVPNNICDTYPIRMPYDLGNKYDRYRMIYYKYAYNMMMNDYIEELERIKSYIKAKVLLLCEHYSKWHINGIIFDDISSNRYKTATHIISILKNKKLSYKIEIVKELNFVLFDDKPRLVITDDEIELLELNAKLNELDKL